MTPRQRQLALGGALAVTVLMVLGGEDPGATTSATGTEVVQGGEASVTEGAPMGAPSRMTPSRMKGAEERLNLDRWKPKTDSSLKSSSSGPEGGAARRAPPGAAGGFIPPKESGELFRVTTWYVPPPPPKRSAVDEPPPIPPLPFRFIGRLDEGEGNTAFLLAGERLLVVRGGDVIDQTYRVEEIRGTGVAFLYLPRNVRQHLSLSGGAY